MLAPRRVPEGIFEGVNASKIRSFIYSFDRLKDDALDAYIVVFVKEGFSKGTTL